LRIFGRYEIDAEWAWRPRDWLRPQLLREQDSVSIWLGPLDFWAFPEPTPGSIRLYRFGDALEASYEALRRQRIDCFAAHLAERAKQSGSKDVAGFSRQHIDGGS
jgi:hypothetical protein